MVSEATLYIAHPPSPSSQTATVCCAFASGTERWKSAEQMNVKEWLAVDESAKSLLARTLARRIPPLTSVPPLHRVALHAGHVLEIVGPSGSAKSELLLQAAVACILPRQLDGISYGGSEGVVMMLDLDCRFDMLRLISALQLRINEARALQQGPSNDMVRYSNEGDDVFTGCLKRFFYIRCYSSFDFLAALKTLHAKLRRLGENGTHPHLLMIDSINAFYWIDRAVSSSTPAGLGAGRTALSLQVVSEAIVQELNQVFQTHPLLILATKSLIQNWTLGDRKYTDGSKGIPPGDTEPKLGRSYDEMPSKEGRAVLRDFMPAVWQGFVTHRVILQGPFQPGAHDVSKEDLPFFTAEWESPCLKQVDKFIIQDRGITLKD